MSTVQDELDRVLSQLSDAEMTFVVDSAPLSHPAKRLRPPSQLQASPSQPHPNQRFTAPKSDSEVKAAKESAVPKSTAKSTSWAVNIWREWRSHRIQACGSHLACPPHLLLCRDHELDYWLTSWFIVEGTRKDRQPYPSFNTVRLGMWSHAVHQGAAPSVELLQRRSVRWISKSHGWRDEATASTWIGG